MIGVETARRVARTCGVECPLDAPLVATAEARDQGRVVGLVPAVGDGTEARHFFVDVALWQRLSKSKAVDASTAETLALQFRIEKKKVLKECLKSIV